MVSDPRESRINASGVASWASGDAGTAMDIVTVRQSTKVIIENITASYSGAGTTEATVTLYDEPEGTSAADASNEIFKVNLSPGDVEQFPSRSLEEVEDDVVGVVENNDNSVSVTVESKEVGS